MRLFLRLSSIAVLAIAAFGCELPSKPDFKVERKFAAPVIAEKTFSFVGQGTGVIIDTTSAEYSDLITVNTDPNSSNYGLVSIGKKEYMDRLDVSSVLPKVTLPPTPIQSEIGTIEVNSIDLMIDITTEDFLGYDPTGRTEINTAVNTSVIRDFDIDGFTSMVVDRGGVEVVLRNNSGLSFTRITAQLFNSITNENIGTSISFDDFAQGDSLARTISFDPAETVENIKVRFNLEVPTQSGLSGVFDRITADVNPDGLEVKSATVSSSRLESQDFVTRSSFAFSNEEVNFSEEGHYVIIDSGYLVITDLINDIKIGLSDVTIESDKMIDSNGNPLRIEFSGAVDGPDGSNQFKAITKGEVNARNPIYIDLKGYRVFGFDPELGQENRITYKVSGTTENVPQNPEIVIFDVTDRISANLAMTDIEIAEVYAQVSTKSVLLKEDQDGDGHLDILNDYEAIHTVVDAFDEFKEELDDITFFEPELALNYGFNAEVGAELIIAVMGEDEDGNQFYLQSPSRNGTTKYLSNRLLYEGSQPIALENLVIFEHKSTSTSSIIRFDNSNSNVEEFLNKLPVKIRFTGRVLTNPLGESGKITNPVEFDGLYEISVPFAIQAESAEDEKGAFLLDENLDFDLSFLPSAEAEEENRLSAAKATITYVNGLPLPLNMEMDFLDDAGNILFVYPAEGQQLQISAAQTDPTSSFATETSSGTVEIDFNNDQLLLVEKVEKINLRAYTRTGENEKVKLRFNDTFIFKVKANFEVESSIN